jgi:hypothetical protein
MSDYDKEIEEAFDKFIADALSATETESQGRYILGMTNEYRGCFEAGAKYQKQKDAERVKELERIISNSMDCEHEYTDYLKKQAREE